MAEPRYDEGDVPHLRSSAKKGRHLDAFACPYCGGSDVLLSYGDLGDDPAQIELYCDNSMCDVREFVVLVMRADDLHRTRADIQALHAVDMGTVEEQRNDGFDLTLDASGRVAARMIAYGDADDPVTHNAKVLARRSRASHVTVEPADDPGD